MAIDHRPESLTAVLKSLGEFALMVCGIIGIAVQIFHDQGLLKGMLESLMNEAFTTSLATIVVGGIALVMARIWFHRVFEKAEPSKRLGDFMMRGMMIAGAFFLYLYLTTGSFKI